MTADLQREWTTKPAELLLACPMLPGWRCILWFAYMSPCAFSFHWCSYGVLWCVKGEPETTEQKALEVPLKLQSSSSVVGGDTVIRDHGSVLLPQKKGVFSAHS